MPGLHTKSFDTFSQSVTSCMRDVRLFHVLIRAEDIVTDALRTSAQAVIARSLSTRTISKSDKITPLGIFLYAPLYDLADSHAEDLAKAILNGSLTRRGVLNVGEWTALFAPSRAQNRNSDPLTARANPDNDTRGRVHSRADDLRHARNVFDDITPANVQSRALDRLTLRNVLDGMIKHDLRAGDLVFIEAIGIHASSAFASSPSRVLFVMLVETVEDKEGAIAGQASWMFPEEHATKSQPAIAAALKKEMTHEDLVTMVNYAWAATGNEGEGSFMRIRIPDDWWRYHAYTPYARERVV